MRFSLLLACALPADSTRPAVSSVEVVLLLPAVVREQVDFG
jgi:hypothetical protein